MAVMRAVKTAPEGPAATKPAVAGFSRGYQDTRLRQPLQPAQAGFADARAHPLGATLVASHPGADIR